MGWDGGARGPAAAPSHHTHYYAAAFSHALRSAFALEPNAVARPAVRQDTADDDTQRTRTTKQTTAAGAAARQRAAQQQKQSAARQDQTDRTNKRQARQKREKQNNPAQQTTVQDRTAAALSSRPRPTPPSACLTPDARKGIGRSPNGAPAICSHGPPEVRVGFWTAPQTILQWVRVAQVAARRGEAKGTTPLGELRL